MKKYLLSLFTLLLPLLNFAQESQEIGIDQKIDEAFGSATGWFVDFIFYQIDFGGGIKIFLGTISFNYWSPLLYILF